MRRSEAQSDRDCSTPKRADALPPGTPAWITPELVQRTIRVWQPFYPSSLTPDDAVTILGSVGRLFQVLSRNESR
jgi:hypothetical protein